MSGNGVDLGAIYQAIIALSENMNRLEQRMERRFDDGLSRLRKDLGGEIADLHHDVSGLRQEVRDYHGAVVGHGIMLTEHDERITKLEQTSRPPEAA